jgi:hypothetical protein
MQDEKETQKLESETLKRLLSTPPTPHKPKSEPVPGASPKKRGRPAKAKTSLEHS